MINKDTENIIINEKTSLLADQDLPTENNHNYNSINGHAAYDGCVNTTGESQPHAVCGGYENNNSSKNKLIKVVCVSSLFFLLELTGGLISGSLALLSDSFHLLSDVIGFLISLIAVIVSQRKATKKYSFGYHRAEIIGALLSLVFIWVLTIGLVIGAVDRLRHPVEINANIMLITAIAGVFINIVLALTLEHGDHGHGHSHGHSHGHGHRHPHGHRQSRDHDHGFTGFESNHYQAHLPTHLNPHSMSDPHPPPTLNTNDPPAETRSGNNLVDNYKKENINVKAAIIHIAGDLISSVGVVIAATIIYFDPSKVYIDPICTFIFSIIVIFTTINLLKQTLSVIMESTPEHIDSDEVIQDLKGIHGIVDIHDLHIWNITIGKPAIAAHISVRNEGLGVGEYQRILNNAQYILCTKYAIHHTTLQIEYMEEGLQGPSDKETKAKHAIEGSGGHSSTAEVPGTSISPPSSTSSPSPPHSSHSNASDTNISIDIQSPTTNYRNYSSIHCKSNLCC